MPPGTSTPKIGGDGRHPPPSRPAESERILLRAGLTAAILAAAVWLAVVPASLFLLLYAVTWKGRALALGVALSATALALLPVAAFLARRPWRAWGRRARRAWGASLAIGAVLLAPAPFLAPSGTGGDAGLRVAHAFTRPGARFPRTSLANLLPEVDQVSAGLPLARALDRHMDGARARRIRGLFLPVYRDMARDPAFRGIGSVMTWAYADAPGYPFERSHYAAIVPRRGGACRATLLFLHGSAGSFSIYWYALAPLARAHGIAVICPGFGFGEWQRPRGVETAMAALEDACRRYSLDPERVFLAALSNGGRGATRIVAAHPGRFRGVALISAVLEEEPVRAGVTEGAWRGLPVLVLHGSADDRVPWPETETLVGQARAGGASVSQRVFPGEDHFLFLSQREQVLSKVARWAAAEREAPVRSAGDHRPRLLQRALGVRHDDAARLAEGGGPLQSASRGGTPPLRVRVTADPGTGPSPRRMRQQPQ
ncbi:MAG: prolyl oligopeptidase family serine peptidase [Armatimonadetes bacterium]|nr:prolyl oligopeptidase family serine peptidase [Armatimonadota bacterium]